MILNEVKIGEVFEWTDGRNGGPKVVLMLGNEFISYGIAWVEDESFDLVVVKRIKEGFDTVNIIPQDKLDNYVS